MKKSEIIEGNKLIAKFINLNQGWSYHQDEESRFKSPYSQTKPNDYTKWHDDWAWLMQLVEKIESLEEYDRQIKNQKVKCTPYRVDILGRNMVEVLAFGEDSICLINENGLTKMEAIYKAVIEFIKFYNEHEKTNDKIGRK